MNLELVPQVVQFGVQLVSKRTFEVIPSFHSVVVVYDGAAELREPSHANTGVKVALRGLIDH